MTKKLESKELTTAEEMAEFWDRHGSVWLTSVIRSGEAINAGVNIDEYTDGLRIRFDGSIPAGGKRVVRHNFEERLADPSNWK